MSDVETVTMTKAQADTYARGLALIQKLESDPRSKPLIESAVKVHFPDVVTEAETMERAVQPHLAPVMDGIKSIQERFAKEDEERAAARQRETEQSLESRFADYQSKGYTEDGIAKIKQLMVDRSIADPDAAVALFDKLNPAPLTESASYTPQTWDMGAGTAPGADMKALFENPDAWADNQVGVVLNEMRSGR